MANRWAVANGNWSDTATWNGGTLPSSTDDVFANTFSVIIDQDITVNTLRTAADTGITQGGVFRPGSVVVNITSPIVGTHHATTGATALLSYSGAVTSTINCPSMTAGQTNSSNRVIVTNSDWTGTLTINGNITAGTVGYGMQHAGLGHVIINGVVTGGGNAGVYHSSSGDLTLIGAAVGGTTSSSPGYLQGSGSPNFVFSGTVYAGTAATSYGISLVGTSNNTISGTVYGGNTVGRFGIYAASSTVTTFTGELYAGTVGAALAATNSARIRLDAKLIWNATGAAPISASGGTSFQFMRSGSLLSATFPDDSRWPSPGEPMILERFGTSSPAPQYVRSGLVYGPEGGNEGTYEVPPASSVTYGVPVDNTTGTAVLDGAGVAAIVGPMIEEALK